MHTSGRAQLRHPVRPARDSLSRFAIRRCYVDPQPKDKALDGLPAYDSLTDIPLPSTGFPRYRFPCFNGTTKMCDSQCPFRRASFPSLGDTRRCACRFAPCGPERSTAGLGFIIRSPLPDEYAWRRSGPPKFLGNPGVPTPCSWTPASPTYQAITVVRHGPTRIQLRGLSTRGNFGARSHGIGTRYLRFAVRITPPHARLASGCWPALPDGIGYPQGSCERFL